ncbi:MAG: hypothetical protein VB980_02990, partial [Opitutales bacterium]
HCSFSRILRSALIHFMDASSLNLMSHDNLTPPAGEKVSMENDQLIVPNRSRKKYILLCRPRNPRSYA